VLGAALVWTLIGITSVEPRRVVRFSVPLSPDSGVAGGRLGIPRFATLRLAISADGNRIAYPDDSLTVVVLSNVNGNALLPLRRD
jgi:hypothetical protein